MTAATKRVEAPSRSATPPPTKIQRKDVVDELPVLPAPVPAPAPASQLRIKKLSKKARLPTRGSPLAAGYDLYR